jgi:YYY domain-containing protein
LAEVMRGGSFPPFDYWAASRVIPFTINEFPLWTFTFADLHPHLISMPFGLLTVGLALNWIVNRPVTLRQWLLNLLLIALALGALGAINTWDLPTYALLVAAAMLLAAWRAPARGRAVSLLGAAITALAALIVSVAAYLPFYLNYQAQVGGGGGNVVARFLGLVKEPSAVSKWLLIWGFFLFVAVSYTVMMLLRRGVRSERATEGPRRARPWLFAALLAVGALAVLAALGQPTVALAALPLLLALPLVVDRCAEPGSAFAALLLALGLAVVAGIEIVYLRDFLEGGDWYRMNTLFKFSVPAWLFLGLASSYMVGRLWRVTASAPAWFGVPWQAAAGVLLAGGLIFLLVGVRARTEDRFPNGSPPLGTLDATAYMDAAEYTWPSGDHRFRLATERAALKWLLDTVDGTPVVAEAPAGGYVVDGEQVGFDYYRAGGLRVASITGLPTFLGQHQYEQRPGEQIGPRSVDARAFWSTTDLAEARRLIDELRIGYVYVGPLERLLFDPAALRKFDVLAEAGELRIAYQNPDVTIYEALAR